MKKLICAFSIIIVVILAVAGIYVLANGRNSTEMAEIYVTTIAYKDKGLSLGELEVKEHYINPPNYMGFIPVDVNELMKLVYSSEYYKGRITYFDQNAYYFVKNNNAYMLYPFNEESWVLENMYSSCSVKGEYSYYVPSPEIIDYAIGSESANGILRYFDRFYEIRKYSETKRFYQNFDIGFAVFDDEAQTIKIKVYDTREAGFTQKQRLIYDFVKKDIGVIGDDGSIEWVRDKLAEINSGT